MDEDKNRRKGERRARTRRSAKRAQRLHLRYAHPLGPVDCVCEQSVWYFRKAKPFGRRRRNYRGLPKIAGRSCGAEHGLRRRIKERIAGRRLAREWIVRLAGTEAEDIEL